MNRNPNPKPNPNRATAHPGPLPLGPEEPPRIYRAVATFADPRHGLTPAYYAAQRWGLARVIVPLPSFGDAAHMVRQGLVPAMVVPAGEPVAAAALAEEGFALRAMAFLPTPERVLAGAEAEPGRRVLVVCPPGGVALLAEVPFEVAGVIPAPSALVAAEMAAGRPGLVAITDLPGARHLGLTVHRVFGPGPEEAFCCIARRDDPVSPVAPGESGGPGPAGEAGMPALGRQRCGLN